MKKRRVALGLVLVVLALAAFGRLSWSPPGLPATPPLAAPGSAPMSLRSWAEHDAIRAAHGEPYVAEWERLLYYGAGHTNDPAHPQFADIAQNWSRFAPTVALCEGRAGYLWRGPLATLDGISDPEQVHALARRDDVPLYTLEPSYATEVTALLETWPAEQVALYMFFRGWSGDRDDAAGLLRKRTDVDGLRGALPSVDDVDRIWARDFPNAPDWRDAPPDPGYLADIADASRQVRGEHMVATLVDFVRRGERVFAVVGSGHVIRQEPALRALLE